MKVWFSQHVRALLSTFVRLARTPVGTLFNLVVIGVALALPAGLYAALTNVQGISRELASEPQISLFLALDATRGDVAQIEGRIKQHAAVREYKYVSREQALQDIKRGTGLADIVETLVQNPLPDAFVVNARNHTAPFLERLRDEFQRWPKVAHVQVDAVWAQRLDGMLKLGRMAVLLLAGLLAFALVAITFNTIRLQILTQRDEIEVAKLIGATDPFIRRPFLYFGAVQGFIGGLAAWGIVWAGIYLLNGSLAELSHLYGTDLRFRPLMPRDSLSLLVFSAWLGWFGAWLSANKHLAQFDPR